MYKKIITSFYFSLFLFFLFEYSIAEEKINPTWMVVDSTKNQVTFNLKAAYNGNNGSWNYNGFYNGSAQIVVPTEWDVLIKFHNPDGNYRHSIAIIKSFSSDKIPEEAGAELVAVPRAYSVGPEHGCLSCKEDIKFKAKNRDDYKIGKYAVFCGVPGHGAVGMWIGFSVKEDIDSPYVVYSKALMDSKDAKPLF